MPCSVSPRGELQVRTGASDAGCPRSHGLPLRHLSAAGRGGAHLRGLHNLLPVCRSAAGEQTLRLTLVFFMSPQETEEGKSF